jgi:hypothetical protein
VKPGIKLDSCGADPSTPVWLLDYDDSEAGVKMGTVAWGQSLLEAASSRNYLCSCRNV